MPEWALLGPGLGTFVASYGGAVLAALQMSFSGGSDIADWLYAPIVGPFVLAGMSDGVPEAQAVFSLLGIAQAAGIALLIAGLAINRRAAQAGPSVTAVPLVAPNAGGLALSGRF